MRGLTAIEPGLAETAARIDEMIRPQVAAVEKLQESNLLKVIKSFQACRVGEEHFAPSTGYGYEDAGRDTLEAVYARAFGAQAAVVRPQIVSGTHAISLCLFGIMRPGDELLSATGSVYDTLEEIVGLRGAGKGSLRDFGITYREAPLGTGGFPDPTEVKRALKPKTRVVLIQRSRGYSWRPALRLDRIAELVQCVKEACPGAICVVDNCYGEFVEEREPTEVGADLIAGSLIKNPGGGLATTGGYVAGAEELVALAAERLTAPGIGREVGAWPLDKRAFYQGLFVAPHVVGEALKGAAFTAGLFAEFGFSVSPTWNEPRGDTIEAIRLGSAERLVAFCRGIQKAMPVDAHVAPEPGAMPGYADMVIMAGGVFVQGSSIELSVDGPMREPFVAYLQGGLSREHVRCAALMAAQELGRAGLLPVPAGEAKVF